ncbi:hypothetical protein PV682_28945 [Streptomyces niveiscabiei]|uniref:hypothetical protein n=1 Tax=Streptomyces niveiscabiei TaxID=164115 RepID=UPI0029BC3345|nr:hypothetical protein [Streptomyces niveiscabiei]MDX3385460.1 hypothetical protein [Streptomyces niveiscabiei]
MSLTPENTHPVTIAFSGPDNVGKTKQIGILARRLDAAAREQLTSERAAAGFVHCWSPTPTGCARPTPLVPPRALPCVAPIAEADALTRNAKVLQVGEAGVYRR